MADYQYLKLYTRPDSYMGPTWYGYYPVAGRSRDSRCLEESNFATMLALLGGETGDSDTVDPENRPYGEQVNYINDVIIVRCSHWAVGWVETIYVHSRRVDLCLIADKALGRLESYPVLDENDWSWREMEAADAYWKSCSISERVRIIQDHGNGECNIFAARRDYSPNDSGTDEYLRQDV